jgi:hypothetical protein
MRSEVIVKLVVTEQAGAERQRLDGCARDLGVSLTPLHPGTTDRELASYFVASVDSDQAERITSGLRRCPGVDAAYVKPAGEPPERM